MHLEQHYLNISNRWLQTYLNLEFADSDRILGLVLSDSQRQEIYGAMKTPVQLAPTLQRALDIYERQFINILSVHHGQFISC